MSGSVPVVERASQFSTVVFALVLSPALFQAGLSCDPGNAKLASLELHAGGIDRVVSFDPSQFNYDAWVDGATQMTVRASPADPRATVRWTYDHDSGVLGQGGGEASLPVASGSPYFFVHVRTPGGAAKSYRLSIDPPCVASQCDDANECTSDLCNPASKTCDFVVDTEQAACAFEGGSGLCMSGMCVQGRRWAPPVRIGGNMSNVRSAEVAFGPDGEAFVVWREDDGASFNVGANRFTPSQGWSGPERLSIDDGAQDFEEPHLAVDPSGNAIAVWRQNYHVFSSRFTRAGGWDPPARIDSGVPLIETRTNGQPRIALYPGGDAIAVWRVIASATDSSVWSNRFAPDDGWGLPERIEFYAGETSTPRIAPIPDGGALVVWQGEPGPSFATIRSARFTLENGWSNAGSVGTGRWWFPPELVYNDAGEVMYVFLGDDSFGNQRSRRYSLEDGWAPITELLGATGADVSAGMDRNGAVLAAWDDIVAPSTIGALAARSVLGEGFDEPIEIGDLALTGARDPDLAVHPDGHAIAVFGQPDGARDNIWFNRFTPAQGWETPAPVERRDADVMTNPRVAMDSAGNAIAVWEESVAAGHKSLWASRYALPSGPDARSQAVVVDAGSRSFTPRVAVNARGLALVVWDSDDGMAARFRHGTADWGYPQIIQDDTGNAQFPIVALDDHDGALVIWQQAPHAGVYYARYSPAFGWEPPGPVDSIDASFESGGALAVAPGGAAVALWKSDGTIESSAFTPGQGWGLPGKVSGDELYDSFDPRAFLGPNGDGFAVWKTLPSSLWSRRYLPGTGFTDPELITDTVVGVGDSARVAVAADGSAIAVWHRYYGGEGDIWHSHYEVGQGWSPPAELDQTDDPFLFDPRIGMDAQGNAIVVWRQASDELYSIWSRRYSPDFGWSDAELIELASGQSEDPALAVSSTGHAVAVWSQGREAQPGFDLDVWVNRYAPAQGWGVAQRIEYTGSGVASAPDVGVAHDGTAIVTWGDGQQVWCRVLTP